MAQLMPLPLTVSCFKKIQIGFTFLVPAHPGCPGQSAVKRVCVCYLLTSIVYLLLQAVGGRMEQRLESGLLTGHAYAISNVRKVWPGARFCVPFDTK